MRARDEVLEKYLEVIVKDRAARLIVDQPQEENETELDFDKAEELARLMIRADALNDARATVEDSPEDLLKRWKLAAVLMVASSTADS